MALTPSSPVPAAPVNPTLVLCPHPLFGVADRQIRYDTFRPGESIAAFLERLGVSLDARPWWLALNDRILDRAEWATTYPKAGDIIAVRARVHGGDEEGGSNPVATILSIVLLVFAPGWGQSLEGFLGIGKLGWTAIIMVAGSLLINALVPNKAPGDDGGGDSPTYSLTNAGNRARPYEPLPLVFGTHKIFPDIGAKPFNEFRGQDQYLYSIFNFGLSDITLTGWKIGESDLSTFAGVEMEVADPATGVVTSFPSDVETTAGGVLEPAGPWVTRTSPVNTVALAVDIQGMLFRVERDGMRWQVLDIEMEYSPAGANTWQPLLDEPEIWMDVGRWAPATSFGPERIILPATLNGRMFQNDTQAYSSMSESWGSASGTSGATEPAWNTNPGGRTQDGTITWRCLPDTITASMVRMRNFNRTPIRRTYRRDVPAGQYDVRVRRITGPLDDGVDFAWSALRSYQADATSYAGQQRVGLIIKASGQISGTVDQFSAIASARCPVWNGSAWVTQATSNPAWWFLWFARGKSIAGRRVYGCGMADARIDIATIQSWATFCTTNNLTFNAVLDRPATSTEVLTLIARAGRAAPTWASGKLGVVWDAANLPVVAVFGMSNIVRNTFGVEYITGKIADEVVVNFINPDLNWQQDTVRVTVPGVTSPQRPVTVELFGCTNLDQAGREANLIAAGQLHRLRRITWESDQEGLVAQRGDVVQLSHDLTQWGYSGRVLAGDGATVQLARAVPFYEGETAHYLGIVFPNGYYTVLRVVTPGTPGEYSTLTLSDSWPTVDDLGNPLSTPDADTAHVPYDYKFMFAPQATPGKRVKIVSVKPVSMNRFQFVATDDDPAYYASESDLYDYAPPATFEAQAPTIISASISDTLIRVGGGFATLITLTWDTSGLYGSATVRAAENGQPLGAIARVYGREFTFQGPPSGLWDFEIQAFAPNGRSIAAGKYTASYEIVGKSKRPDDVPALTVSQNGAYVVAQWDRVTDVDVNEYELRRGPVGVAWENATVIPCETVGRGVTTAAVPPGNQDFLIKAKDSSGLYSLNAARTNLNVANSLNIITAQEQAPDWTGSRVAWFDGTNDYGAVAYAPAFELERTAPFTIVARIFCEAGTAGALVSHCAGDTTLRGFVLRRTAGGALEFALSHDVAGGNYLATASNSALAEGRWLTVGVTYAGTALAAGAVLYVDGAAVAATATHDALTGTTVNGSGLHVGQRSDATLRFAGGIAEVVMLNRAATADEMSALHQGIAPAAADTISRWLLVERAGNAMADENGSGRNLALTGVAYVPHPQAFRFVRHWTGVLIPDQPGTVEESNSFDWCDQYLANPYQRSAYIAPETDIDFTDDARVWGTVNGQLGPDETTGRLDAQLALDYRPDAGAYDGFEPWTIGERDARYFLHRLDLNNESGKVRITGFVPTVDQIEFTQRASGLSIAAGGQVVNFPDPFHLPPDVVATSAAAVVRVVGVTAVTATGFTANVYDPATGTSVGGPINYQALGV